MRLAMLLLGAVLGGAMPARAGTLYDDLGANPGIERIVDTLVAVFDDDPRVGPLFEDTNMVRFRHMLVDQLCAVSGGGCTYTGQTMYKAHRGLHLQTKDFNALVEDLQTAMDRVGVAFPTQNRLLAQLAPMYRDVVSR